MPIRPLKTAAQHMKKKERARVARVKRRRKMKRIKAPKLSSFASKMMKGF